MDLLANTQLSVIVGKAGSGKSLLSCAWALSQLEKGKVERISLVCNPVAVSGAGRLGLGGRGSSKTALIAGTSLRLINYSIRMKQI